MSKEGIPTRIRMAAIGTVVAFLSAGCQQINPSPEKALTYDSLQGILAQSTGNAEDQFFHSKEDFLKSSVSQLPITIVMHDQFGKNIQIAGDESSGWIPGAFVITDPSAKFGALCLPSSDERKIAYRLLFNAFQKDQQVNTRLIETLTKDAADNCNSYYIQ